MDSGIRLSHGKNEFEMIVLSMNLYPHILQFLVLAVTGLSIPKKYITRVTFF